jgi:hypothetical protein
LLSDDEAGGAQNSAVLIRGDETGTEAGVVVCSERKALCMNGTSAGVLVAFISWIQCKERDRVGYRGKEKEEEKRKKR